MRGRADEPVIRFFPDMFSLMANYLQTLRAYSRGVLLFLDMARDFAKQFYRSVEWQHMRQYILIRDKYTCQRCHGAKHCGQLEVHHKIHLTPENIHDASITLNDSNLITLCRDCHFEVHEEDKLRGNGQRYEHEDCDSGMMFDENGYLVEKK